MSFAPDDDDVFGGGASVWGDAPSSSASSSSLASIQPSQQVATDPLPTAISSHTLSQPQIPSHEPASSKGYSSFDPSSFSSGFGGAVSASLEDDGFGFSGQPEFLPPPIPTQKSDFTIPPLHHTEAASPYDRLPALDPLGPGIYDEDIRGGFADPAYGSPFGAPPIPAQSVPPRRAPTNSAAADHSLNATLLRAYHAAQQQKVAAAEDIIPNPLLGDLPAPIPPPAPKKYSPKPAPAALPHPVPSNPLQEATAPAAVPAGGSLADQVIQNATRTDPLAADSSPVVNRDSVLAPPSPASHDLDDPFFGAARANSHPEPVASSSPKPKLTKTPKNGAKFIDPLMALSQDDEEDSEEESGPAPGSVAANNSSDKELPSTEPIEAAYKFDVRVTEPQKVGADLINAHVTYKVKTKTNCPEYRNPEFGVTRRYRDFLWLYNQLQERYPGVIIPPIPEKNALGRFQNEFVETRRLGLERCLKRITIHPLLQSDADLRMFLESETFAVDVNQKRREENKTGFMSVFTTSLTSSPVVPTATKIENDEEFFVSRRNQLDAVENQLRFLLKAVEVLIKQRRDLGATLQDFGESLAALGTIEVNKPAAQSAIALGKVQIKIKELYERQAKHDLIHIFGVVDEYVRVIGSIKLAFASRVKAFVTWQTADTNSYKKRDALNKLKASAKIRSDKISFGEAEIIELEKSTAEAKQAFHDITERLRSELIRYDQEKVADFASGIQGMLKSMIETQKEIVGLWESYFAETGQPVPSFAA